MSCELYRGDCLKVMATLDAGSIGAVICDAPYGIEHSSSHGSSWEGTRIANDHDTALRDWIVEWAESRRLPWAVFGSWKRSPPLRTRATLVWDKGPAFGMGDLSMPWKPSWEEIYIGGKGWQGKRDEGVLRGHIVVSWESRGRKHPHQKPVSLLQAIMTKLPSHLTILDPCMGTGTTGVAALNLGHNFIGIEIDPAHFRTARQRLAPWHPVATPRRGARPAAATSPACGPTPKAGRCSATRAGSGPGP